MEWNESGCGEAVQLVWGRRKTLIEIERLQSELAEQTSRAGRAEAERDALRAELDHVRAELTTADQQAQRLSSEHAGQVAALTHRVEVAENRAAELSDHLTRSDADLVEARAEAGELTTTLAGVQAGVQAALESSQHELTTARCTLGSERDQALADLATARDQAQLAGTEHADQVLALTRAVEAAESRIEELGHQLAQTEVDLTASRHTVDQLQDQLRQQTDAATTATAEASAVGEQLTQLRRDLDAARAQDRQTASALADARSTLASTRAELATAQDKLARAQAEGATAQQEPATEPNPTPARTTELTDQPNPPHGQQRQQPSRRRRRRPAGG